MLSHGKRRSSIHNIGRSRKEDHDVEQSGNSGGGVAPRRRNQGKKETQTGALNNRRADKRLSFAVRMPQPDSGAVWRRGANGAGSRHDI